MINKDIEMFFSQDPFLPGHGIRVCLCERDYVQVGSRQVLEPTRRVVEFKTEPLELGDSIPPTFMVGRHQLQQLANDLAIVGVYPEKLPQAQHGRIEDLHHARDFAEKVAMNLIGRKGK